MSQNSKNTNSQIAEMKELADLYFQNKLSEKEQTRLVEILSHNYETQQAYVDYMHDTYYLTYLAEGRIESFKSIEPCRSPVLNFLGDCSRRSIQFITQPTPFSITVAFVVILSFVVGLAQFYLSVDQPTKKEIANKITPEDQQLIKYAKMIRVKDVTWAESAQTFAVGDQLKLNNVIQIQTGLVEIGFGDGSIALIEGPASLEVVTANRAFLNSGKLTAKATKGFMVSSPNAKIIDLGTVFGISVGEENGTKISVLDGAVKVVGRSKKSPFGPLRLTTNQSITVRSGSDNPKVIRDNSASEGFAKGLSRFIGSRHNVSFEDGKNDLVQIPSDHYPNLIFVNAAWIQPAKKGFHDGRTGLGVHPGKVKLGKNYWSHPVAEHPIIIKFIKPTNYVAIDAFGVGVHGAQMKAFDENGATIDVDEIIDPKGASSKVHTLTVRGQDIKRIELIQPRYKVGVSDGVGWDNLSYGFEKKESKNR